MIARGGGFTVVSRAGRTRRLIGVLGATLALSVVVAASSAAPASAAGLNLGIGVNLDVGGLLGVGSASSLDDALNNSPTNLVQGLACPLLGAVSTVTSPIPGVGAVTDQVKAVACALSVLGYAYRTTYTPASGPPVVRYTRAVAALPTLLDVNGDGLPDFTGAASPSLTLNGITLNISRLLFPAGGKVSIEAVFIDPLTPGTYVGVGEDGSAAGTAGSWNATVSVLGISSTTADLGLNLSASGAPATLATLGEVFSGPSPDAPTTIDRGSVGFTPVPASFNTEIRLGQGRQEAIVTSPTPTTVTAHVNLISPGDRKDIDATIDQLPASVDLVHLAQSGHETVTYTASAPIGHLSAAYHDRTGTGSATTIATAAQLDATNVPAQITFDQAGGKATVSAPSGAFGSVEARFATGGEVPAPGAGSGPYAAFHRISSSKLTAGLRLTNLKSVTIDPTGPYAGELVFSAPLGTLPLSAQDDVSAITLTGSLSNLPLDTTVSADVNNGVVTFDGHGTGIGEIALHATKSSGTFFTRANRIDATIEGIPATETINFQQAGGGVTVNASNPIGTITLLASDGSNAPAVGGSYAWYEDTPARYRAFVRISGLTGLSFNGSPVSGSIDTSPAQVLSLHAQTGGATYDGVINKLPPHVGFSLTPGAGGNEVVDYDSAGVAIDQITLDATGLPLPSGATNLHAEIDGLPSHMTLTLPADGGKIVFDPHGGYVGRLLAQAYGAAGPATASAGHQALYYNEPNSQITVDLHNVGGASATETASPLSIAYDIGHDPLDYGVQLTDGTYINGTISNPQPATIFVDPSGGDIAALYQVQAAGPNFTGDGSIDEIDIATNAAGGYLEGALKHVPAQIYLCAGGGTRCKPTWVPLQVGGFGVDPPDFAVQLQPKDINNQVPAARVTFNGRFCPDQPDAALCSDNGHHDKRVVIDDLQFNTVEAGFHEAGCGTACANAWAAFNTESDHINGRVRYYGQGDDDPTLDFDAPDPDNYLAAQRLFFFVHADAVNLPPELDTFHGGSLLCGDPKPSAEIEIPGPNIDILGGTFGVCP